MKSGKKSTKSKKGSASSSSRAVTISNNSLATNFSGPKSKNIAEEQNVYYLINSITTEIVQSAMDEIYQIYLERTSSSFAANCAHLAWLQCFNLMDLKHDSGENSSSIEKFWSPDEECKPVPRDSWTCRNIPIRVSKKPEIIHSEPKLCKSIRLSENAFIPPIKKIPGKSSLLAIQGSVEIKTKSSRSRRKQPKQQQQQIPEVSADAESQEDKQEFPSEIDRAEELSIFTETISMSTKDLPMSKWPKKQTSKKSPCQKKIPSWAIDTSGPLHRSESAKDEAVHPYPLESHHVCFFENYSGVPVPIGPKYLAYKMNNFMIGLVVPGKRKLLPLLNCEQIRIKEHLYNHKAFNLTETENDEFPFFRYFINMDKVVEILKYRI
ncbi:uncharacterized protein LOC117179861 isoform X2 [Belonocnema kinseyi]|uniref:uncharacterized protein LOC117179861 isoform X2 n=1 Tax=Belonocnema kinseyi TaxID=2817044 RepID=UPI00143D7B3D|nr:uncharacterized protein LOC117179861 isoform X2 [Belonocnema kinseyi]